MKKNLTFLTGIVFLITILVAGSCGNGNKQEEAAEVENESTAEAKGLVMAQDDSTIVRIYLKEKEIDGIMHLLMYDSRKPECPVIDNLETEVFPGDTVIFMKAKNSKVKEVISVSLVKETFITYTEDVRVDSGLYVLKIDSLAPWDTMLKYDIEFATNKDTATIDPYLRIPPEDPED